MKLFTNNDITNIACYLRQQFNGFKKLKADVVGKTFEESLEVMCGMDNIDTGLADNICNDILISAKATKSLNIYSTNNQSSLLEQHNIKTNIGDKFIGLTNNSSITQIIERRLADETIIPLMEQKNIESLDKIINEIQEYKNKTIMDVEEKYNKQHIVKTINAFKSVTLHYSDIYDDKMFIIISVCDYSIPRDLDYYGYCKFNASSVVLTKKYNVINEEMYCRVLHLNQRTKDNIINDNIKYIF
jgi:hypothetical protein